MKKYPKENRKNRSNNVLMSVKVDKQFYQR